jgi:uncharacterized membrane protein
VGLIMSVVVAVVEKKNAFLRFNAFQSLLIHGVAFALSFGFTVLSTMLSAMDAGILGLLVSLVSLVVSLGLLGLMIFMMIKAYGGEELQLPYIGPMAKKWSA